MWPWLSNCRPPYLTSAASELRLRALSSNNEPVPFVPARCTSTGPEAKVWSEAGYQGQNETIHQNTSEAQEMTSRRVNTKAGVDETGEARESGYGPSTPQGGVAVPHTQARVRIDQGVLPEFEEEARVPVRGLRTGEYLPAAQTNRRSICCDYAITTQSQPGSFITSCSSHAL